MAGPLSPQAIRVRRRRRVQLGLVVLGLTTITGLVLWASVRPPATDRARFHQQVFEVSDVPAGDRLLLVTPRGPVELRLLGIDAYDRETARQALASAAGDAVLVYLIDVPTRDAAGTLFGYAYAGELLLNEAIIARGEAFADRRLDHPYRQHFEQVEATAARARRGIWAIFPDVPDKAMPPWRRRWLSEQRKDAWDRQEWRTADEP